MWLSILLLNPQTEFHGPNNAFPMVDLRCCSPNDRGVMPSEVSQPVRFSRYFDDETLNLLSIVFQSLRRHSPFLPSLAISRPRPVRGSRQHLTVRGRRTATPATWPRTFLLSVISTRDFDPSVRLGFEHLLREWSFGHGIHGVFERCLIASRAAHVRSRDSRRRGAGTRREQPARQASMASASMRSATPRP